MDAFSEILSQVKLHGALFFNAEFSAPWVFASPHSRSLAPALSAGAPHLVIYHLVLEGTASARTLDGPVIPLEPGDVVVFPQGDPHMIGNGREADSPRLDSEIMRKVMTRDLTPMQAGGGGEPTRFVCGFMACDPHLGRPVLSGLPPVLKVNVRTDRSGQWLESSIRQMVEEAASGRVGSDAMLAKLSEALFVDTLRRHIAALPEQGTGWLMGTRDPIVGKSLLLLHRDIARPWTIADLAHAVGLSRSALVERFTRFLSQPPMAYLTRWRLQVAARALVQTDKSLADISSEVGYESEAAFSRAFKRALGSPPARYRRERRTPPRSQ
jgi:AraC-like DNA-binding protein